MAKIDPFTARRLSHFVEDFRSKQGQLPTFQDFERAGFDREVVKKAVASGVLEEFFVTLTNGTIVKGLKVKSP